MFNLVRADLYKATKSKMLWILLTLTTICAMAMFSIAYGIGNNLLSESMSSIGFLLSDMNMLTIIGAVLATTLVCSDFETKNIHHPIISGYSRMQIVGSKALVFWLLLIMLAGPFIIVTFIGLTMDSTFSMGGSAAGYLSLLTSTTGENFSKYVAILTNMTIIHLAQLTVCILLAFVFRKAVLVVTVYYMMSMFFGQVASFPATFESLNKLLSFTPFAGEYITMNLDMSAADIMLAIITCITFMVAIVLLTFMVFRKAEIK